MNPNHHYPIATFDLQFNGSGNFPFEINFHIEKMAQNSKVIVESIASPETYQDLPWSPPVVKYARYYVTVTKFQSQNGFL